jgi:hypothetical protein
MLNQETRSELRKIYAKGNITLFLGAGVSKDNGLPNWKELVSSLFFKYMAVEEWHRIRPFPNYLQAISQWYLDQLGQSFEIVIRGLKTNWGGENYHAALWDVLYNVFESPDISKGSVILDYLGEILSDPSRKIKSVITYNYDSLLEQTLSARNIDFEAVYSSKRFTRGKLPVYHVHGFLPYLNNPEKKPLGQIILSEEDYNAIVSDSNYWGNVVQITALAGTTNIMIGLSLTDRNLRRILDVISKQPFDNENYIFLQKKPPVNLTHEQIERIHDEAIRIMERMQLNPYIKTEARRFEEIPQILEGVINNQFQNEERILKQLKIKPIWYDEHNEVAAYLHYMYQDNQE